MSEKQILALIGPAGSGKSTLADLLVEHRGFIRLSFAAPIKQMLKVILDSQGATRSEVHRMLYGNLKEVPTLFLSGRSPRHAMQTLGTEWRDLMNRDLWTNIWTRSAQFIPKIIVDDMRFTHEAAVVRDLGGKIVQIDRPGFGPGEHLSEKDYLNIKPDFTINNDVNPETLLVRLLETGVLG